MNGAAASCTSAMGAYNNGGATLDTNNFLPWTATGDPTMPPGWLITDYHQKPETGSYYSNPWEMTFITGDPFEPNPQNTAPIVPPGNVIQTMYNLLENSRCSNFISSLINTARQLTGITPISYSARDLIGIVASQPNGGYHFVPGYSNGSGGGEAGGSFAAGTAGADIGGQAYGHGFPRSFLLTAQVDYALTGLHETIHLAGGGGGTYTDKVLAQAVFAMFGNPNDDPSKVDASSRRAVYDYGGIWDKYLQDYCGGKQYNGNGGNLGSVP